MDKNKPTFLEIVKSVLSSFFGVQSDKNRQRDFQQGNPMHFIGVGLGLTIFFVITVIVVVKLILHFSGQ